MIRFGSTWLSYVWSFLPSQLVQSEWKRKFRRVNELTCEFDNHVYANANIFLSARNNLRAEINVFWHDTNIPR